MESGRGTSVLSGGCGAASVLSSCEIMMSGVKKVTFANALYIFVKGNFVVK